MIQQGHPEEGRRHPFPVKEAGSEPFSSQAPNALCASAAPVWLQEDLTSGTLRQDPTWTTPLCWTDSSFPFHHFMAWICPTHEHGGFAIAMAKTGGGMG